MTPYSVASPAEARPSPLRFLYQAFYGVMPAEAHHARTRTLGAMWALLSATFLHICYLVIASGAPGGDTDRTSFLRRSNRLRSAGSYVQMRGCLTKKSLYPLSRVPSPGRHHRVR